MTDEDLVFPNDDVYPEIEDRVSIGAECPRCKESRVDYLVWVDDGEKVRCSTCGKLYVPPQLE